MENGKGKAAWQGWLMDIPNWEFNVPEHAEMLHEWKEIYTLLIQHHVTRK